ncbi:MAG: MFS transporter [Cyclobacteriaceae bacterium]|jgi:MHS family proline/betaine transporter-like MFS transporter|nr:MFS transporter [Cyclobacteriaceae bacterium]
MKKAEPRSARLWPIITASSVGTLIEWYDFYLFGSLATVLSVKFFPQSNPTAAFLSTLATFAAGFIVRPFGALVFGRLGDRVGRKYTFLVTLLIMGGATFAIGLIPGYEQWGLFAPALVLLLRLLQGLALGGEYGGAATYVAEHSPAHQRGFYTSFIQTTATLGLFVSIGVIVATRKVVGEAAFAEWGWRIPFLLSAVLVAVSVYIRLRMQESPLFARIKSEGKLSVNPLRESFTKKENLRWVLLALFGATAGQGVVWYTGQFYAMTFIQKTMQVELTQSYFIMAVALVAATPLFVFFGWWSDKIGRKYIMLAGLLLAVVLYRPIYQAMYALGDVNTKVEQADQKSITTSRYRNALRDSLTTTETARIFSDGTLLMEKQTIRGSGQVQETKRTIELSGRKLYALIALIFVQVVLVTLVYGPIAAFLVELFPTRIRYTSMSLPYHLGNGVFGGLTPLIATYLATRTTDPLAGLWYPIAVAAVCFVIGLIFLPNKPNPSHD